jgi:hypothetical protein
MLIWYFSNNLDIYDCVGKLPKQHFSVWLVCNPGDTILFLLKGEQGTAELGAKTVLKQTNKLCF